MTDALYDLVDTTREFYGVDWNQFKLGDKVFEAKEDPSDGYRSYLGSIEVVNSDGTFFKTSLDQVKVIEKDTGYFKGYELVSMKDGHVWLKVGTNNNDDYYPYFVFNYSPRE